MRVIVRSIIIGFGVILLASPALADGIFIVTGETLTSRYNPDHKVRVGERLPVSSLKKRFVGFDIQSTSSEDCNFCASVSSSGQGFQVNYDIDGIVVTSILCFDGCADALGNEHGSRLLDAIGDRASCDAGLYTTCRSPRIDGLNYILYEDSENCDFEINGGETRIPACAKVGGFQIGSEY